MTTQCHFLILADSVLPYMVLLKAAFVFSLVAVSMLLFIVFFLYQRKARTQKKQQLRSVFSDLIAEITLCETEEERNETLNMFLNGHRLLLTKTFPRKVLIREIVKTKDSISGSAAQNLNWLYKTLSLDKDTYKHFLSNEWHRKARAIQYLAEMQQQQYLTKIYRETNNKNNLIRTEAQIAVVKLTGFKGLRFLQIAGYPISQWQQLCLISQLQEGDQDEEKIKPWLRSQNATVVEFSLRLVGLYKCFTLHNEVSDTLRHPSETVRLQALQTLAEISNETTPGELIRHFANATKQEQLIILDMMPSLEVSSSDVGFLSSLVQHQDEAIRHHAMQSIRQISPGWPAVIGRPVQENTSNTYILSNPAKKAV